MLYALDVPSLKKVNWLKLTSYRSFIRMGNRARIGKDRLRAQFLPKGSACSYVRVTVDNYLARNVFAYRWTYNKSVCWITQLVVHRDCRERRLAVGLLNELKENEDDTYGLVSSHPAACAAAARVFGSKRAVRTIPSIQL